MGVVVAMLLIIRRTHGDRNRGSDDDRGGRGRQCNGNRRRRWRRRLATRVGSGIVTEGTPAVGGSSGDIKSSGSSGDIKGSGSSGDDLGPFGSPTKLKLPDYREEDMLRKETTEMLLRKETTEIPTGDAVKEGDHRDAVKLPRVMLLRKETTEIPVTYREEDMLFRPAATTATSPSHVPITKYDVTEHLPDEMLAKLLEDNPMIDALENLASTLAFPGKETHVLICRSWVIPPIFDVEDNGEREVNIVSVHEIEI
ncbi:hypothetical protein RHMOL_Rhmol09G0101100 [Rhododendron molle]|uniref:Uncharacterized protein n=1 Tax=Rhododendron molle TaxID=49168 RepID=A0ACC0MBI6_RHOML|nr:hypothetical protein RHMOL_Rhmol09G0101100 [Rhododendron molle]